VHLSAQQVRKFSQLREIMSRPEFIQLKWHADEVLKGVSVVVSKPGVPTLFLSHGIPNSPHEMFLASRRPFFISVFSLTYSGWHATSWIYEFPTVAENPLAYCRVCSVNRRLRSLAVFRIADQIRKMDPNQTIADYEKSIFFN